MAGLTEDSILVQSHAAGSSLQHKAKAQNPCEGCYFFGGKARAVRCCNYYLITGNRRPCDGGEECTVRKDGSRPGRKPVTLKK